MKVLLIGSGAREHAVARACAKSAHLSELLCYGSGLNPGIQELCHVYVKGSLSDVEAMANFARNQSVDLAIVGPEAPLEQGVADALWNEEIPCVGPRKAAAQLETSKGFTRQLMRDCGIEAYPKFQMFTALKGVDEFLGELGDRYVVKFDGLMGGKGVKVAGEHLHNHKEARDYCRSIFKKGGTLVIEEKLEGEEFSLMSFCDGTHLLHTIPVQDHKRAFEGDTGPNTGGMGSYTDVQGSLPFLTDQDIQDAREINQAIARAVMEETETPFQGILYGGFMATATGVKVIEYNVRFGDPEVMNVLALMETDFLDVCQGIVFGNLDQYSLSFSPRASVCKYAVPKGYPDNPMRGRPIDISSITSRDTLYLAAVDQSEEGLVETGSRTAAVVRVAESLEEAERIAEKEIRAIKGPLFHRKDIGTAALIRKRVAHMNKLRG
ncbi:MAG: phosphoribosylamine--glycine ligase [FCB group bacterium]|nr:phosphoribosylamine--glycine ligase [FCB group bacterium]